MRRLLLLLPMLCTLGGNVMALAKPHTVSFGKAFSVKWLVGAEENRAIDLKARALYVDTRLKEFTLGPAHEVTDRLFVVRRIFRLNDTLPEESALVQKWRWQRGGWLLVDRLSGHVTSIALPEFDPYDSAASWYRDYVAYCGVSDDGKKFYLVVAQIGRRKAVLKESAKLAVIGDDPDSFCPAPLWQRQPTRVTFNAGEDQKFTYTVRGHVLEIVKDEDDEEADAR